MDDEKRPLWRDAAAGLLLFVLFVIACSIEGYHAEPRPIYMQEAP